MVRLKCFCRGLSFEIARKDAIDWINDNEKSIEVMSVTECVLHDYLHVTVWYKELL